MRWGLCLSARGPPRAPAPHTDEVQSSPWAACSLLRLPGRHLRGNEFSEIILTDFHGFSTGSFTPKVEARSLLDL